MKINLTPNVLLWYIILKCKECAMSVRIKFEYNTDKMKDADYGMSRQKFTDNKGQQVRLFVHFKEFYFEIVDDEGNALVKGGKTKNRAVLLRQAKKALVNLGCTFKKELRHRERKEES